jgi:hypothetical protein
MTDDELNSKLRTWQAPPAPETLRKRVFREQRSTWSWLQWIFTGEIRIPAPVALVLLALLMFFAWRAVQPPAGSLSDFQQVHQLQPRIVRTIHETR